MSRSGHVFDPTKGPGVNIRSGSAAPRQDRETLSEPTMMAYCKTCERVQTCETGEGGEDEHPWLCRVCGQAPHETPKRANKAGRRFS